LLIFGKYGAAQYTLRLGIRGPLLRRRGDRG
jgi:hypothetical protein